MYGGFSFILHNLMGKIFCLKSKNLQADTQVFDDKTDELVLGCMVYQQRSR